jgi:hypothetical protein
MVYKMANSDTVMKYAMRPVICGIVGKLAASMVLGIDSSGGSLPLGGMDWSPSTVIGVSIAGATAASSALHDTVLTRVKSMNWAAESTEKAVAPILAGLLSVVAVRFTVGPLSDLRAIMEIAAVGGLSEISGTYLHDDIIMPAVSSSGGNAVMAMR